MNISEIVDFCQMNSQLANFVAPASSTAEGQTLKQIYNFFVTETASDCRTCRYCGSNHPPRSCPAYGKSCNKCGRKNHFAKCCRQKVFSANQRSVRTRTGERENNNVDIFTVDSSSSDPAFRTFYIGNRPVRFQLDTGCEKSIISKWQREQLGCPVLQPTSLKPTNYDGSRSQTLGEFSTDLTDQDTFVKASLLVIESDKPYGLLGRDILSSISYNYFGAQTFSVSNEFLSPIKGFTASISLKDDLNLFESL